MGNIPKKIHYCWFGGNPLPDTFKKCIESWERYCPDYEIIRWDENNFDISSNNYVKEAYDAKKWAFVTDYVRLFVLFKYGGIYMDSDVEVIQPLDTFLKHRAFTGCESDSLCVTGTIGSEKNHPWIEMLLEEYTDKKFVLSDGKLNLTPNTTLITNITKRQFGWNSENSYQILHGDLHIYPFDFFCAKDLRDGKVKVTKNTCTIHHFSGSWLSKSQKNKILISRLLGTKFKKMISSILFKFK